MDAIDIPAGAPPRATRPLAGRVLDRVVAVAPSTQEPAAPSRWPRGLTFAFIGLASLAGWVAIISLAVFLT